MAGIDQYTVLMLPCSGSDAATSFPDLSASGHTATVGGNAQVDTGINDRFGAASGVGLFDGTGDYLTFPDHPDWDFGTDDFTIDFGVRFNSTTGRQELFSRVSSGDVIITKDAAQHLKVVMEGVVVIDYTWSLSAGIWYHIAVARSGSTLKSFIDGVEVASVSDSTNVTGTGALQIGSTDDGTLALNGWLDEYRISKGIARWTANFTPPSEPYSVGSSLAVQGRNPLRGVMRGVIR